MAGAPQLAMTPSAIGSFAAEPPHPPAALEALLDRAFGPGRHAKVSERVRERFAVAAPDLSRLAFEDGALIGCCRIHRLGLGGRTVAFLGPLAVEPARQHGGIGAALVEAAVAACAAAGLPAVVLVGAPDFFQRLGFVQIPEGRVIFPGPVEARRAHWRALAPEGLVGLEGPLTAPPGASPA